MTNPLCPNCGHKMIKHGSYGMPPKYRYICKNKECCVKTLSQSSLARKYSYSNTYINFLTLILNLLEVINYMKITPCKVTKLAKEVLNHNKLAVEKDLECLYLGKEFHMQLIHSYNKSFPILTFIPDPKNDTIICGFTYGEEQLGTKYSSLSQMIKRIGLIFDYDELLDIIRNNGEFTVLQRYAYNQFIKRKNI